MKGWDFEVSLLASSGREGAGLATALLPLGLIINALTERPSRSIGRESGCLVGADNIWYHMSILPLAKYVFNITQPGRAICQGFSARAFSASNYRKIQQ